MLPLRLIERNEELTHLMGVVDALNDQIRKQLGGSTFGEGVWTEVREEIKADTPDLFTTVCIPSLLEIPLKLQWNVLYKFAMPGCGKIDLYLEWEGREGEEKRKERRISYVWDPVHQRWHVKADKPELDAMRPRNLPSKELFLNMARNVVDAYLKARRECLVLQKSRLKRLEAITPPEVSEVSTEASTTV